MIKRILLFFLLIISLIISAPAFISETLVVERSIVISSPQEKVFPILSDLHYFHHWNPWKAHDSNLEYSIDGQGVDSTYSWKGEKVGEGQMTIVNIVEGQKVEIKLSFLAPFQSEALTSWQISALSEKQSQVSWHFRQELPYFYRYFGITMRSMLGNHFDDGLMQLKALMEAEES